MSQHFCYENYFYKFCKVKVELQQEDIKILIPQKQFSIVNDNIKKNIFDNQNLFLLFS